MGALLGLTMGLGLLLVFWSVVSGPAGGECATSRHHRRGRLRALLDDAGLPGVGSVGLLAICAGCGGIAFLLAAGISRSAVVSAAFGCLASSGPLTVLRSRRTRRQDALRDAWPDVVDDLTSAVRAGLALPEGLVQLGERGPEQLRPAFAAFAADFRATGRFGDCLDRLKERLADPVGDRVVESLRIAREVGGADLGSLLRSLSGFLREDARTRGELESRQAWTVNGARVAVAAPWLVLALLSSRPQAVHAYDSPAGVVLLGVGGVASLVAYRVMLLIGRLPREERVLA
jgi:tight adherence protein B